eukprot:CAMPEP_0201120754 /NCGR_PEP_ID=MMETSP0850-20130426/4762_1 /ASSEMBLY_ACC=CAM_ASM_000622 /TAXON_ID=183588 /ORGANISM="Pseudo-nitzschia fraudulenta, Strain WWA7" /LENGTH=61 /DNA_ID=CAMNT_0047386991 /DNA_START=285 /DNA_END=470 /DNA_ORIENTATION=-
MAVEGTGEKKPERALGENVIGSAHLVKVTTVVSAFGAAAFGRFGYEGHRMGQQSNVIGENS